jgi:hypothetical protein
MEEGLLAEFESAEALVRAARRVLELGFTRLDAFTPHPVSELETLINRHRSRIPAWVLGAGLLGGIAAYVIQWWTAAVNYPLDVGGRPYHSAPAFIPITFETTVLCASLMAFFAWLAYAGLPRLWHPVFEVTGFQSASNDHFWLGIDPSEHPSRSVRLVDELVAAGAIRVSRTRGAQ